MEEIREKAMDEVLTALPMVQDSVLSCVQVCTDKPDSPSLQKIKNISRLNFIRECGDDFSKIQKDFVEKKDKKETVNESILIDVLADIMYDGIQLFDDEELAAQALEDTKI